MPESMTRLARRIIDDHRSHYTLNTSIVSGRALPEHPVDFLVGLRLVRVGSDAERTQALRDPAATIRTLDRALIASQRPTYGMPAKCPVQGDILEGDVIIDFVIASRMVRVCCRRCERVVRARPHQYLAMVDYANAHGTP